jgi:hypothetical protein
VTEPDLAVRRRAAERAKQMLEGNLSPDALREEFADVEDRAVAALLDLLEHRPVHGVLGGGEGAWQDYQCSLRDVIAGLSA